MCWSPSQEKIEGSTLHGFMGYISERSARISAIIIRYGAGRWKIRKIYWDSVWDYCGVIGDKGGRVFDDNNGSMYGSRFFPEGKLNYAQNLLEKMCENGADKSVPAMIFRDETGAEGQMNRAEMLKKVSQWQQAMKAIGVTEGDRVACYMPNMMETLIAALAAISLGAIWSSASPDFGVQGVLGPFRAD